MKCIACGAEIRHLERPVVTLDCPLCEREGEGIEVHPDDLELTIGGFLRKRHVMACALCIVYGHIAARARLSRSKRAEE